MRIKKCRACKKNNLKRLFSLGSLCFTGKFPSIYQKIKKGPIVNLEFDIFGKYIAKMLNKKI